MSTLEESYGTRMNQFSVEQHLRMFAFAHILSKNIQFNQNIASMYLTCLMGINLINVYGWFLYLAPENVEPIDNAIAIYENQELHNFISKFYFSYDENIKSYIIAQFIPSVSYDNIIRILDLLSDDQIVLFRDTNKRSLLHLIVSNTIITNEQVISLLTRVLNKGINIDQRNTETALNYLIQKRGADSQLDIIKFLVDEKGSDINKDNTSPDAFFDTVSILHKAVLEGDDKGYETVTYLLDRGADVNVKSIFDNINATPLEFAEYYNPFFDLDSTRIIELLRQRGSVAIRPRDETLVRDNAGNIIFDVYADYERQRQITQQVSQSLDLYDVVNAESIEQLKNIVDNIVN
jgi:hypothetical protein